MTELPRWFLAALAGVLGLVLGSFLNVCIVRWGAEPKQSVVRPRSRCPRCGASLKPWDNIPVLSWLVLGGKCRSCGMPISVMYPLVELGTGIIWALMFLRFGSSLVVALELAIAATILLGVALTDARAFVIPHEFTLGGAAIALAFGTVSGWHGVQDAALGAFFGAGLILLIGECGDLVLGQETMGGGDAALMGMIGAFFGWELVLFTLLAGSVVSIVLFALSNLFVSRPVGAPTRESQGELQGLRWGMMGQLLLGGLVLIALIVVVTRAGGLSGLFHALFLATIGAGVAYYLIFLLPGRVASLSAARVRGFIGAALAIGSSLRPWTIGLSLLLLLAVVLRSRSVRLRHAPESTDQMVEGGYLPFGVGLAIAAAVALVLGGPNVAHELISTVSSGFLI